MRSYSDTSDEHQNVLRYLLNCKRPSLREEAHAIPSSQAQDARGHMITDDAERTLKDAGKWVMVTGFVV